MSYYFGEERKMTTSVCMLLFPIQFLILALYLYNPSDIIISENLLWFQKLTNKLNKKVQLTNKYSIRNKLIRLSVSTLFQFFLFYVSYFFYTFCMNTSDYKIPKTSIFIVSGLVTLGVCCGFTPQKKVCIFLRKIAVLAVILYVTEIFVFNMKGFCGYKKYKEEKIPFELAANANKSSAVIGTDEIVLTSNGNFQINTESIDFLPNALAIKVAQSDEKATDLEVIIEIKDNNSSQIYYSAADKYISGKQNEYYFKILPYEKVNSIQITVNNIISPVTISSIKLCTVTKAKFQLMRYLILLLFIGFIIYIREYGIAEVDFDRRKLTHKAVLMLVILACLLSCIPFYKKGMKKIKYTYENGAESQDPYCRLFTAIKEGKVSLDMDVDPALTALSNPYDGTLRNAMNVKYSWDYALYNGQYYSYFGITPVLAFYFPYYLISGALPTVEMTVFFYTLLSVFFMCLTIIKFAELLTDNINLLLLSITLPTMTFASNIYYCLSIQDMYFVPVSCGICFMMMSLYLSFSALLTKNIKCRCLLLLLAGTSLALCAASRYGMACSAAVLLPFFFGILCNKKVKLKNKILQAVSFVLPVLIGVCGIMYYNYIRFDDPFQLGAKYQITVSDIHANYLNLSQFASSVFNYFLILPNYINKFPYLDLHSFFINNQGKYLYYEPTIGLLCIPIITFILFCMPLALKTVHKNTNTENITALQKKAAIVTAIITAVLLGWIDFCIAGSNTRYMLDFQPMFCIVFSGIGLMYYQSLSKERQIIYIRYFSFFAVLTFIFQYGVILSLIYGHLDANNPKLLESLEEMIVFLH